MRGPGLLTSLLAMIVLAVNGGVLEFTADDAGVAYRTASALVHDCTPRNAGTKAGAAAAAWLQRRLCDQGVDARLDRFRARANDVQADFVNVIAQFPANDPKAPWVVLISHFDTAPNVAKGFEGANDGASTSGLLVALAGSLRRAGALRSPVMLVWTDAEECRVAYGPNDGFQGSKRLLQMLKEQRREVKAAICLDMLGDRDLNIMVPANSTAWLRELVLRAARKARVQDRVRLQNQINVSDDHSAFFDAGLPAVDLIDFEFGSAPGLNDYWHTPKDTLDKISSRSLFCSGRLAVAIVNLLEER